MSGAIDSTVHDLIQALSEAMQGGNPWLLLLAVVICVGIVVALKGKLTSSFLWIPGLALVAYYAIYRWLRLR